MRQVLNSFIPYDAIARWWYVLVAGSALGLVFSLATDFSLFRPLAAPVVNEPLGDAKTTVWVAAASLKDDLLLTVLGLLMACGVIWLLEEIREYNRVEN